MTNLIEKISPKEIFENPIGWIYALEQTPEDEEGRNEQIRRKMDDLVHYARDQTLEGYAQYEIILAEQFKRNMEEATREIQKELDPEHIDHQRILGKIFGQTPEDREEMKIVKRPHSTILLTRGKLIRSNEHFQKEIEQRARKIEYANQEAPPYDDRPVSLATTLKVVEETSLFYEGAQRHALFKDNTFGPNVQERLNDFLRTLQI